MKTHKVLTSRLVEIADEWRVRLTLIDDKGMEMKVSLKGDEEGSNAIFLSRTLIVSHLQGQGLDSDLVDNFHIMKLMRGVTIIGTIKKKKVGENFIAVEGSVVYVDGEWILGVAGETYVVQRTGYRIDYDEDFFLDFNPIVLESVANELRAIRRALVREQADVVVE